MTPTPIAIDRVAAALFYASTWQPEARAEAEEWAENAEDFAPSSVMLPDDARAVEALAYAFASHRVESLANSAPPKGDAAFGAFVKLNAMAVAEIERRLAALEKVVQP